MGEIIYSLEYYRTLPYAIVVDRDDDEGEWQQYYIAQYEELPGCIGVGKSRQEAIYNLHQVFDDYIEGHLEWGDDIPLPKRVLLRQREKEAMILEPPIYKNDWEQRFTPEQISKNNWIDPSEINSIAEFAHAY